MRLSLFHPVKFSEQKRRPECSCRIPRRVGKWRDGTRVPGLGWPPSAIRERRSKTALASGVTRGLRRIQPHSGMAFVRVSGNLAVVCLTGHLPGRSGGLFDNFGFDRSCALLGGA